MPDLADRQRRENELSAALFAALLALRSSINSAADGGDSVQWTAFQADLQKALLGGLSATVDAAGVQLATAQGEGAPVDMANDTAGYATTRAAQLSADITSRLQSQLPGAAPAVVDQLLSKSRADMISITEITAAISAGEALAAVTIAAALQRKATWRWVTAGDDIVCATCGALDGKQEPDIEPPAHPGCRCTKEYDFSKPLFGSAA